MKNTPVQLFLLFILLVLLQVGLFGYIRLFSVAAPLLYIYFLIKLPVSMNRNTVLFLSVLLGFVIDIFDGTLGLNMTAMAITGFLRFYLLKLFAPRDIFDSITPAFSTFGKFIFMRYAGVVALIQISLLYSIESFSLFTPGLLLIRIASSLILTILLIFAFESINSDVFKK